MPSELQTLIDDLAARIGAPAILEDRDQRTVVYSAHSEPIDDLRRQSILRHRADPGALAWFRQFGIFRSTEPVRIPPQPHSSTLGRLCIPVRHRGQLLGFLWFIDDSDQIGAEQVASATFILGQLSVLMYDEEMARRSANRVVSRLLSPWDELRQAAASQIVEDGLLPAHAPVLTVVARPLGVPTREARECIGQALSDLARESGPAGSDGLRLIRGNHVVLLVRTQSVDDDEPGSAMAATMCRALRRRLADRESAPEAAGATRVVVGIGEPQERLTRTVVSYRQARMSAQVAARVPSIGDVCRWRGLGVFRVLAQLPSDEAAEAAVDPRVLALFQVGNPDMVRTLETYLDLGCDVKATAERLYLHRATLYYRLQKAERLIGMDLRDGGDRLAIHLGLKLSRLTGQHPNPC
ncbi:MAG TPA: helix-turn-helix domain-containing protein [Mycobacteriales bacterium]|nr:helix-turn-helix domain-containing protein [Mycobacteriales bacterium]